jgi:predicted nucleotidyltransferase
MHLLAQTLHGSRLYGLDNPKSDFDYKAIHLPYLAECLLLTAPRNAHTTGLLHGLKQETESFALQEFLALASRGEDVAITMLHVDDKAVIQGSDTFNTLRRERFRFYTNKMSGSAGYCRGMAAKYALRADRMETVEKVVAVLKEMVEMGVAKLGQAWDMLPDLPHTNKGENLLDQIPCTLTCGVYLLKVI